MGKRIKDSYGRYAGFVVGINTDPFGEIKGIAIDSGQEGLVEIPRESIHQDGDFMILTPQWKLDADKFRNENSLVKSRAIAVEELLKEGEITNEEYSKTRKLYEGYNVKLVEMGKNLEERLRNRDQDLDREANDLKNMSTNIKIQFKSGEVDAESFRASLQYTTIMKERIEREKNDLLVTFNSLSSPADSQVDEMPSHHQVEQVENQPHIDEVDLDLDSTTHQHLSDAGTEAGWLAKFLKGRA